MKLSGIAAVLSVALVSEAWAREPFQLYSTSFSDNGVLARKYAGRLSTNSNCIGQNTSPQLSWKNVPAGTRSLTFVMIDPEGRNGLGVVHWLAYGVPPSKTSFGEGEASSRPSAWAAGKTTHGPERYVGPCTPPGTSWHHYTFVAIATDLEPGALPSGLDWPAVRDRLDGHAKASAGLVGRFRKPE